jgi:hypothetical protein
MIKSYEMMELKSYSQKKETRNELNTSQSKNEPVLKAYLRDKFEASIENLAFLAKCHLFDDQNKQKEQIDQFNEHIFLLKNQLIITDTFIDEHKMKDYKIYLEEHEIFKNNLNRRENENTNEENSSKKYDLNTFYNYFLNPKIIKRDLKNVSYDLFIGNIF